MRRNNGLSISLKSVDLQTQLKEYPNPEAPKDVSQCYVESIPGQKFAIVVNVHDDFAWHGAIGLRITWSRESSTRWCFWFAKPEVMPHGTVQAVEVTRVTHVEGADTWMRGELSFAEYEFDDNEPQDTQEWKDADKKRGYIKVEVTRVSARRESGWQTYRAASSDRIENKAPIKVVKDKGVTHHVQSTNSKPCSDRFLDYEKTPLSGRYGKAICHKMFYRPKYVLRKLSVCPPSPLITATEPVDLTELDDDDEDDNGNQVAEFVDLTQPATRPLQPKRELPVDDDDLEAELERAKRRQLELEARLKQRASGSGATALRVKREISSEL